MTNADAASLEGLVREHRTHKVSEVTSEWDVIMEEAREKEVIVTRHDHPEAVIMSTERYLELKAAAATVSGPNLPGKVGFFSQSPQIEESTEFALATLQRLDDDFDRELAALRDPTAADKLREVFAASPDDIADAANAFGR
ncbi:MAG TPA: hypothetical protein VFO89_03345 [Thermoanaerobaculia bacterium]|nr:hypothetical protein [Thermoanaerobaculia bacterium]